MAVLRIANLALAFLLELAALFAVGAWTFSLSLGTAAALLLAVAVVAVYVTLWAIFAAPKAATRLRSGPRAAFEVVWFGSAAILAALSGRVTFAIVFVVLVVINRALLRVWRQQEHDPTPS
jgi:hypothetical protein